MNKSESSNSRSPTQELITLLKPGVLGFYTHIECTEIFANKIGHKEVFNVFTIVVAEERPDAEMSSPYYLTTKPIRIKSLKNWSFGIRRYILSLDNLMPALIDLEEGKGWKLSGDKLEIGMLQPMPAQFVPPDNGGSVPWNRLIKNNFWTGSHLLEWSNHDKETLLPFYSDPRRLQELAEQVEQHIPLQLAAMSDRLGNIAVQLPVTVLIAEFQKLQNGNFQVEHAWHPKAIPRPLTAVCELEHDDIVTGFASSDLEERITVLPMRSGRGLYRGFIWDKYSNTLLLASGPGSFISTISLNMRSPDPEPRTFTIKNSDGSFDHRRVALVAFYNHSLVGDPQPDDNGGWTEKRMYAERASRLAEERRFVQYRPCNNNDANRRKALNDIRALIDAYGKKGAWLWDPYLSANDVLETLFYCPYQGADLRGLTSQKAGSSAEIQRNLDGCESNWRGLKLEFRMQKGQTGWAFHDRFLIFPSGPDGAMAWSLGTSVNSLGIDHHILQKVDNSQLIVDAFTDLWELLNGPDHLIWKRS